MLKCILPAKWFGLSDTQLEECLKDRLSFRRFVGLSLTDATPNQTTFVRFRARLREANLDRRLFDDTLRHLDRQSLLVKDGTLVDATIIEQSRGSRRDDGTSTRDPEASFTLDDHRVHQPLDPLRQVPNRIHPPGCIDSTNRPIRSPERFVSVGF